ncbi:hypothetical protein WR25_08778 [Diploscapter pachys]|uniref:Trafficking protein particle complex subunit 13 n=1 Tax=Diploscapter pachys TaxID=2018661 RepID=A0A2A2KNZ4_9BILA|nr:hypothetical protein WR25_08778 [Diploscapter pachys]
MSDIGSPQQLLSLKVMRLVRPKLMPPNGGSGLSTDPADPSGFSQMISDATRSRCGDTRLDLPVGEFLIAPQMFENIYLGETFTFYVTCINETTDQKTTDVCVKCELQTNSQRVQLPCNIDSASLGVGESTGEVISHEVKEIGQHILICSVSYKTPQEEKMYFRKFFKFPVAKPIDVKTKFYSAENDDVFLEAQIENTSTAPMFLEKIELESSQNYTVTPILLPEDNEMRGCMLNPKDVRQYLFVLSPTDSHHQAGYKDMTTIGKLDMCWRTSMGERGRLQTSPLQRITPGHGDIRLFIDKMPACVRAAECFEMCCRIMNCTDRPLDLKLMLESTQALIYSCPSGVVLGQVGKK